VCESVKGLRTTNLYASAAGRPYRGHRRGARSDLFGRRARQRSAERREQPRRLRDDGGPGRERHHGWGRIGGEGALLKPRGEEEEAAEAEEEVEEAEEEAEVVWWRRRRRWGRRRGEAGGGAEGGERRAGGNKGCGGGGVGVGSAGRNVERGGSCRS
jgi:hypothetical protein